MLMPADAVEIVDTWRVLGLRGTGSHDVSVAGATCPNSDSVTLRPGEPATDRAVDAIAQSSLIIAAVAVGVATGALADTVALAADGKPRALSQQRLAESAVFQDRLGEAHTVLQAARALLRAEADAAHARAARAGTALERAQLRAAAAQVTALASRVMDEAHLLSGGTAVYESSPMQRRLRDIHTATQHFVAGRDSYRALGALLVGVDAATGQF